jgi:hypothetical protein
VRLSLRWPAPQLKLLVGADAVPFWKVHEGRNWLLPSTYLGERNWCGGKEGVGLQKGWLLLVTLVPKVSEMVAK